VWRVDSMKDEHSPPIWNSVVVACLLTCPAVAGCGGDVNLENVRPATGGVATGGVATGGAGTGGVPAGCTSATSMPAMGSACSPEGEWQRGDGYLCRCSSGIWQCDCPAVPPAHGTACPAGMFCGYYPYPYPSYPSGAACDCVELVWVCWTLD
jgi:hypothetical protein